MDIDTVLHQSPKAQLTTCHTEVLMHLVCGFAGADVSYRNYGLPGGQVIDQVLELGLDQLAVEVGDRVLERVLVALLAVALVAARPEAAPLDRHALTEGQVEKERDGGRGGCQWRARRQCCGPQAREDVMMPDIK